MTYISGKKKTGAWWPYRENNKRRKYGRMVKRITSRDGVDTNEVLSVLQKMWSFQRRWIKRRRQTGLTISGLLGRLSPEQRAAALAYTGDDTIGDPNFGRPDDQ